VILRSNHKDHDNELFRFENVLVPFSTAAEAGARWQIQKKKVVDVSQIVSLDSINFLQQSFYALVHRRKSFR
jgi:hypothetical protein